MSTEKTDALVIRLADFSESSRVVTMFTRDFGKVAAIAKGAKRLKGPFDAALDLLSECRIVFIRKSSTSLDILTEARLVKRFTAGGRELNRLYGGYYVAELLDGLSEPYDPHPELFAGALQTLANLADTDRDSRLTVLRFELEILHRIGQLPDLSSCIACSRPATSGAWAFWVGQGGVLCANCQKPEYQRSRLQAGTLAILQKLSGATPLSGRVAVSDRQFAEMRPLMTSAICNALGKRPKMLRYLQS